MPVDATLTEFALPAHGRPAPERTQDWVAIAGESHRKWLTKFRYGMAAFYEQLDSIEDNKDNLLNL
jgi:hypothetical protein